MEKVKQWTSLPMPDLLMMAYCRKEWTRGSLLNRPLCFPDNPLVKELSYRPSELTFFHSIFFVRAQFYHTDFRTS